MVMVVTAAGFAGLMSFHTKPASLSLGVAPPTSVTRTGAGTTTTTGPTSGAGAGTTSGPASPTTTAPAATTSATGSPVNYFYGIMSVSVTGSRTHITNVHIAAINEGGNSFSVSIDQYALPILESEALSAQSANIQGVSGASYTSAGFAKSLQSALSRLGGS